MAIAAEPIVRDRLFIGGEWVEPAGDGSIEVVNPTTEQTVGRIPEGTVEDADRAVRAARAAFDDVVAAHPLRARRRSPPPSARSSTERGDELAALFSTELGMPLTLSRMVAGRAALGRRSPRSPSWPSRLSGRRRWATR